MDRAVQSAKAAFEVWSEVSALERGRVLQKTARKLEVKTDNLVIYMYSIWQLTLIILSGITNINRHAFI